MNEKIWQKICNRFFQPKTENFERYKHAFELKDIEYEKGKEFKGIFYFLTEKSGGNIHDKGTIEITTNSIYNNDQSRHPKNLVDFDNDNDYSSGNGGDSFVCFDFKRNRIHLNNYTVKSNDNTGADGYHLKNWVIEVSNDCDNWIEIDRHEEDGTLKGQSIVHTFSIQKDQDEFYQFVRLRQTGPCWAHPHLPNHFWFPSIEFYGKIKYNV